MRKFLNPKREEVKGIIQEVADGVPFCMGAAFFLKTEDGGFVAWGYPVNEYEPLIKEKYSMEGFLTYAARKGATALLKKTDDVEEFNGEFSAYAHHLGAHYCPIEGFGEIVFAFSGLAQEDDHELAVKAAHLFMQKLVHI